MVEDIDYCPICGGYFEAGGESTCTCDSIEADNHNDQLYYQIKEGGGEDGDLKTWWYI